MPESLTCRLDPSWFFAHIFLDIFKLNLNYFVVLALTILGGIALGYINAIVTTKGHIPSFITTLGTMMLWRGLTLWFSGGLQQACDVSSSSAFLSFLNGTIGGVFPVQALWFIIVGIIWDCYSITPAMETGSMQLEIMLTQPGLWGFEPI